MSGRRLTFSQREGHEELPRPLALEELPAAARTRIWSVLYLHLDHARHVDAINSIDAVRGPWSLILMSLHLQHDVQPLDEWTTDFKRWYRDLRERVTRLPFNQVFDLVEFIMAQDECPESFIRLMVAAFKSSYLAYTIDAGPPPTIVPAATPEESDQLTGNLKELRAAGLHAATAHLHGASKCINGGDWAGSVRESIHAVESVAKQIDPGGAKELGKALNSLQKRGALPHKALKESLSKLYGYTSDEQGIRHALLGEGKANVTIDEAVFMLGACASFASYLWRKHKAAAHDHPPSNRNHIPP